MVNQHQNEFAESHDFEVEYSPADYFDYEDYEDYEEIEPQEPVAYSKYYIDSWPDGQCEVHWSTNDNLDRGYPSEFAEATYHFKSVEKALEFTGKSRQGIGQLVTVVLDGKEV